MSEQCVVDDCDEEATDLVNVGPSDRAPGLMRGEWMCFDHAQNWRQGPRGGSNARSDS